MLYLATNQLAHLAFFIVWKETIVIPCSFDHQETPLSKWQSACLRKTLPLKDSEGFARLFAQGLNSDSVKFQNNTFSGRPPKKQPFPKRSMIKGIYIYMLHSCCHYHNFPSISTSSGGSIIPNPMVLFQLYLPNLGGLEVGPLHPKKGIGISPGKSDAFPNYPVI